MSLRSTLDPISYASCFRRDGYFICEDVIPPDDVEHLLLWKSRVAEVICAVGSGGLVTMCPLTLHASAASQSVGNRRVIHIEYAAENLPGGLQWNNRVGPALS